MNRELEGVWEHMMHLGTDALAHANRHSCYAAFANKNWPTFAVLQAAHSAELLIKARIAQEHPFLIFEQLPKASKEPGSLLGLRELFERGRTLQWSDLPDRLWAATGRRVPDLDSFTRFGKLRNTIQHFAAPSDVDLGTETSNFVFSVIDPFINESWGLFAIDFDEDDDPYVYMVTHLVSREILFRVSVDAARCFDDWSVDWAKVSPAYRDEMARRVRSALTGHG